MRLGTKVAIPLLIGAIGFSNVARNPRFEAFHTVDVVQLIATGICLGVALAMLIPSRATR